MKLSIVIFNRSNREELKHLLKSIFKNSKLSLEVIVVDISSDKSIDMLFEEFDREIFNEKLKVLSCFKINPSKAREISLSYVTGEYSLFIYSVDKIKRNFLEKLIHALDATKSDIIEFEVKHIGPLDIYWEYPIELEKNKLYDVKNRPIVFSLSSPFIYTKAFKTSFLQKNIEILKIESNYDLFYTYLLLSLAKSYYFIEVEGIKIFPTFIKFNPHSLVFRQWNYLLTYFRTYLEWNSIKKYVEYSYVKYMMNVALKIITNSSLGTEEKEIWTERIHQDIVKQFPNSQSNIMIKQDKPLKKVFRIKKFSLIKKENYISDEEEQNL